MALRRDTRYPGRWTTGDSAHPQGAFKNRSAPGALDGSYIEQDWANDWDGFFAALLGAASITPNGTVDTATSSQYFTAMQTVTKGRLIGVQVFSTAGTFTYTPTPGTNSVIPKVQAGGAGSGGLPATIASGAAYAPSGGAGAYGEGRYTSGFAGATITVGAGGVAGAAGANPGGAGGSSSFGGLLSAPGGIAGPAGISTTTFPANSGYAVATAAPSGANIESSPGAPGSQVLMGSFNYGNGFNAPTLSKFGAGPGSGAPGTYQGQSLAASAGKVGQPGIVIVWEYA